MDLKLLAQRFRPSDATLGTDGLPQFFRPPVNWSFLDPNSPDEWSRIGHNAWRACQRHRRSVDACAALFQGMMIGVMIALFSFGWGMLLDGMLDWLGL